MTRRVSPAASADPSAGVPQTPAETPADVLLTAQVNDEMNQHGGEPGLRSEKARGEGADRSAEQPSPEQDLRAWAAALAAKLPPLAESQVAAAARLVARLDARDNRNRAA